MVLFVGEGEYGSDRCSGNLVDHINYRTLPNMGHRSAEIPSGNQIPRFRQEYGG